MAEKPGDLDSDVTVDGVDAHSTLIEQGLDT